MHGMTEQDNLVTVRKPAWHGLGETLQEAPRRDVAEKKVSDYQVLREPLYRKVPIVTDDGPSHEFVLYEEAELNVRSDSGAVFGAVRKERIDPQPSEVWDIADFIMKNNKNVVVETAGTYNSGADMYILLKLDELVKVQGDKYGDSYAYCALQNAWYAGKALRFQLTNVRLQCMNTSRLADLRAADANLNLSLAHTGNMRERIEEVQSFMAGWTEGIQQWRLYKEALASMHVTVEQTNWFIEQFIPEPKSDKLISDRVRDNINVARLDLVNELYSDFNSGVRGTALGLFEAASSYESHVRTATSQMSRFKRSMLTPTSILEDAAALALEAVTV